MRRYLARHLPPIAMRQWLLAGIGGCIGIALTGGLSILAGTPLLMAPFGATCVLLFSAHGSPLSQPMNVVGGHVVSAAVGLCLKLVLPEAWWAVALAAGLAISLMAALRVTHPPAGANPLVIFTSEQGFDYLVFPVLLGALLLVIIACIFHRAANVTYPLRAP